MNNEKLRCLLNDIEELKKIASFIKKSKCDSDLEIFVKSTRLSMFGDLITYKEKMKIEYGLSLEIIDKLIEEKEANVRKILGDSNE